MGNSAKKTTSPQLSDLLAGSRSEEEALPKAATELKLTPDLNRGLNLDTSDGNTVHTWQENHDHNLGLVHPDFAIKTSFFDASPTVTEFVYAEPNTVDDTGRG